MMTISPETTQLRCAVSNTGPMLSAFQSEQIGFAGLLIRACQTGHITPEEVRNTMFTCQSLGTHYATNFIEGIYNRLKEEAI